MEEGQIVSRMPIGMDLPTALKVVIDGKTITKLEWANSNVYVVLRNGFLILHKDDNKDYQWIISEADLTGHDWVVCNLPTSRDN